MTSFFRIKALGHGVETFLMISCLIYIVSDEVFGFIHITVQKRGANIYAEFLGGSFSCDAYHMTEPRPDGNTLCL